jgi:hypothetical protein
MLKAVALNDGYYMDSEFRNILDSLPEKPPRSRLEPYGELIDGLRRRQRTYRDIVEILAEKCQLRVSISTLHDFLRARSRRNKNFARRMAADAPVANLIPPGAVGRESVQKPSEDEVRQRIAAFKARKPVTTRSRDDFHFDPNEPLRLIKREKPQPDK